MLLSRLAYEVVKSALKLGNQEFIYESFRQNEFDSDIDYSNEIDNCYSEINQAIHRLSDLKKIPFKVEKFTTNGGAIFDFATTDLKIKSIISIVKLNETTGEYRNIAFRSMSSTKVNLLGVSEKPQSFYVEYVEDIPNFSNDDFDYSNFVENGQFRELMDKIKTLTYISININLICN